MNFDEIFKRLEDLENEVIYLKAQNRLQDVFACKLIDNIEEHDEQLKEHKEWMNSQFNGLCSSAFNNIKKTGLSFEEAINALNDGKKIKRDFWPSRAYIHKDQQEKNWEIVD